MHRFLKTLLACLAVLGVGCAAEAGVAPSETRLALVVGNASYKAKPLATAINDAALIAQTLRAAGFHVMGARDLDEDSLRQAFRDFVDAVRSAGPGAVAAVYFAGYGLQLDGENYLVPTNADIADVLEVPLRAIRLSEQMHALAALESKATFVILDMARASPFVMSGPPLAGGLSWVDPETNMLIAFNAAPGTISPDGASGYGPYAKALSEMIREGGRSPADLFDRVRLRVNELTKGAQVPWDNSRVEAQFLFFERGPAAPSRADSPERTAQMRSQPMRSLGAQDAYTVALIRDTFDAYTDFLAEYGREPMATQIRALLAARREAITWRRTCQADVPDAYWSYMSRYPGGAHVADARRRLTRLGAATALPTKFAMMEYDVPPPLPDELELVGRAVMLLSDPAFSVEAPQPLPAYFLEPPPPELLALAPPVAPSEAYVLPAPRFVSLPAYVAVPAHVEAPPHSLAFESFQKAPLRQAIGLPAKPSGPAVSAIVPSNPDDLEDSPRLPPSVIAKTGSIDSRTQPLLSASKPQGREGIKVPAAPAASRISMTPSWAMGLLTGKEINVAQLPAGGGDFWATYYPMAWQQTKARPSAGRIWPVDANTMANRRVAAPAFTAEDEVPASRTTMLEPSQRPAMRSGNSSIPLPLPRPARPALRPTGRPPTATVPAHSSSTEVGQARQPAGQPHRAPSSGAPRRSPVELGASQPKL